MIILCWLVVARHSFVLQIQIFVSNFRPSLNEVFVLVSQAAATPLLFVGNNGVAIQLFDMTLVFAVFRHSRACSSHTRIVIRHEYLLQIIEPNAIADNGLQQLGTTILVEGSLPGRPGTKCLRGLLPQLETNKKIDTKKATIYPMGKTSLGNCPRVALFWLK